MSSLEVQARLTVSQAGQYAHQLERTGQYRATVFVVGWGAAVVEVNTALRPIRRVATLRTVEEAEMLLWSATTRQETEAEPKPTYREAMLAAGVAYCEEMDTALALHQAGGDASLLTAATREARTAYVDATRMARRLPGAPVQGRQANGRFGPVGP